jgi:hypothetical protein
MRPSRSTMTARNSSLGGLVDVATFLIYSAAINGHQRLDSAAPLQNALTAA